MSYVRGSCTFIEIDDEIKPSPTKQARLQTFFKSPSKEFADSEIRLPVLATSPKITAAARHDALWGRRLEFGLILDFSELSVRSRVTLPMHVRWSHC